MKSTITKITLAAIASSSFADANPIVTDDRLKKVQESCVVAISDSVAHVSCSVTYQKIGKEVHRYYMNVPVFVSSVADRNSKDLHLLIDMRLECEGSKTTFRSAGPPSGELPPIEYKENPVSEAPRIIEFCYEFVPPSQDEFAVVASYNQPLIQNTAYYQPLFEYGEVEADKKDFTITFFSIKNSELKLVSAHEDRQKIMNSRITVNPIHNETIIVQTK